MGACCQGCREKYEEEMKKQLDEANRLKMEQEKLRRAQRGNGTNATDKGDGQTQDATAMGPGQIENFLDQNREHHYMMAEDGKVALVPPPRPEKKPKSFNHDTDHLTKETEQQKKPEVVVQ